MRLFISILICLFVVGCVSQPRSDYLTVHARINDQPSLLVFDTAASNLILFRQAAERLNLEAGQPPAGQQPNPGKIPLGFSETCRLSCPSMDFNEDVVFAVFDSQAEVGIVPVDGCIGWENLQCNILFIDADKKVMMGLDKLPADIDTWSEWPIYDYSGLDVLLIKIVQETGQWGIILIDTGDPYEVSLNARRWNDFRDSQDGQPYTLSSCYTPAVGWRVYEVRRADTLDIGGFTVSDVPVRPSDAVWEQAFPNYQATLGLFALSRLDVIVDGPGGMVYTRPKKNPRSIYRYNRTGVALVPEGSESAQLVAHVVEDGPAYEAGLRKGDVLLEVNGHDAMEWWKSKRTVSSSFRKRKAGQKVELSVMRGDETVSVTIELVEIFPQDNSKNHIGKQHGSSGGSDLSLKPIVLCDDSNMLKNLTQDRQAAEQGDTQARYNLGEAYYSGMGLPQDYTEALKWLRMAAEQGHAEACNALGVMYESADGLSRDDAEAVKWYRMAAEQGDAVAQDNLGAMYFKGKGVEQDYAQAAKWFLKAAEQGRAGAQCNVGMIYLEGKGVDQDAAEAVKWFLRAAEQGHARAQYNLGVLYRDGNGVEQDYIKAVELFTDSAFKADVRAQNNLGFMYLNGNGVEQDYTEAARWFLKAAEQQETGEQEILGIIYTNLGRIYANGYGVKQDFAESYKWMLLAGVNGLYDDQIIGGLEANMTTQQIAEGRRRANEYLEQKKSGK